MFDLALFVTLFVALAFGWALGKFGTPRRINFWRRPRSEAYLKGLTYLINEQSDAAVDSFISQLDVSPKTLEMHLSIGSLLRRKGEIDRAIRIHQHLIDSSALGEREVSIAQLELARDFYSAGILDRAESILCDLVGRSSLLREDAQKLLLSVYRDERSWSKALAVATDLRKQQASKKDGESVRQQVVMTKIIAHFCCELAEESIADGEFDSAYNYIGRALKYDSDCVRATLLKARLLGVEGEEQRAKTLLLGVAHQDSSLFSEAAEELLNLSMDVQTLQKVTQLHQESASYSGLLYLVEANRELNGQAVLSELIKQELDLRPSLIGLNLYLDVTSQASESSVSHEVVRAVLNGLSQRRARYICHHCGFHGNQMHWLCPSCKQWGEIRQRYGL